MRPVTESKLSLTLAASSVPATTTPTKSAKRSLELIQLMIDTETCHRDTKRERENVEKEKEKKKKKTRQREKRSGDGGKEREGEGNRHRDSKIETKR